MTRTQLPSATAVADGSANGEETRRAKGWEGQTFLVGDLVYVRGIEEGDAKAVIAWRETLFPTSTARAETIIKEDLPKQWDQHTNTMLLVRKADDRVVGSVVVASPWPPATTVTFRVDPLLGDAAALRADAIALVIPWLAEENQRAVMRVSFADDEAEAIAAAEKVGMRQTARYREALWRDGQRRDQLAYEYLNPAWVANLGDPNEVALERTGTGQPRPVTPSERVEGDPPPQAVIVGRRVYLRVMQKEDAAPLARWTREEPERYATTRSIASAHEIQHIIEEEQQEDPPSGIWFSVCLRENDELIGEVGLIDVDYLHRTAETGSGMGRVQHRGAGYGSEAKHLLLEWSFERLGLHMVRSFVTFRNTRSAAALRKQGYQEAGRINWAFNLNGTYGNGVVFDLLAEEWRAMPRTKDSLPLAGLRTED